MMIKASGRSALILATGLFVCFAGPSPAPAAGSDGAAATSKSGSASSGKASSGKSVKQGARHWKRYAHRKYTRTASKSAESPKATEKDIAGDTSPAISSSVANANAQMASPDSASALTAKANTMLLASADRPGDAQANTDASVVASDQLNDLDRALQETPAKQTVAMVSAAKPAAAAPVLAASSDNSTWDQTSLIGKIFIAFGALLTMASAARMFMA